MSRSGLSCLDVADLAEAARFITQELDATTRQSARRELERERRFIRVELERRRGRSATCAAPAAGSSSD